MSKFLTMEDLANRIETERPDILESMESSETEYRLARQILKRRKILNLSQQQLTKKAHLTQCQISRIEKGEIKSFRTLKRALDALDLEIKLVPKTKVRRAKDKKKINLKLKAK